MRNPVLLDLQLRVVRNKSPCRVQAQGVTTLAQHYTFAAGTAGALWYNTM